MQILLAKPQGFCAGVSRAVDIVETAIQHYVGEKIFVYHEIVHNRHVVEDFISRGVTFVENLDEVPEGSVLVLSAHGVSIAVREKARGKKLRVIDATCPLVEKVHKQAQRHQSLGREVLVIGHADHPEVIGTLGSLSRSASIISTIEDAMSVQVARPEALAYVTQTTLGMDDTRAIIDALKQRFPEIHGPELRDICFATQNRQNAVKDLAKLAHLILVIGSQNSSNSNRLREVGDLCGVPSYLIANEGEIDLGWIPHIADCKIGITSGASTPKYLLDRVVEYLKAHFNAECITIGTVEENVKFPMPDLDKVAV